MLKLPRPTAFVLFLLILAFGVTCGYLSTATVRADYEFNAWCVHFKHFMVCNQPAGADGLYGTGGY